MEYNEKTLKIWEDTISSYEKLKYTEAKKLYLEYLNNKSQQTREKLILGTLYLIPLFIKRNKLHHLISSSYDVNDLINSCNEAFLEEIDRSILLKVDKYSQIFNATFLNKISKYLVDGKYEIGTNLIVSTDTFGHFLQKYIEFRTNNEKCSYFDFCNLFYEDERYAICRQYDDTISSTWKMFESIYQYLLKGDELIDLSKTDLANLKYILINGGLDISKENIENVSINYEDELVQNITVKNYINNILNESILTERQIEILKMHFGIGCNKSDLNTIAKDMNITTARVGQLEAKAIWRIRRYNISKRIKNVY